MTSSMRQRRTLLLLTLFAYFWSASCMAELVLLQQLANGHDGAMVQVEQDSARELVFHHAGHQDAHEPTIADASTDEGEHGDHVVALGCEQLSGLASGKDFKLGDRMLTPPALLFMVLLALPQQPQTDDYLTPPLLRNSLPELIRSQRLLV